MRGRVTSAYEGNQPRVTVASIITGTQELSAGHANSFLEADEKLECKLDRNAPYSLFLTCRQSVSNIANAISQVCWDLDFVCNTGVYNKTDLCKFWHTTREKHDEAVSFAIVFKDIASQGILITIFLELIQWVMYFNRMVSSDMTDCLLATSDGHEFF